MNLFFQALVLSVISLSVHGDLVDRCGDGSSYWCKNFNTALECGKISECKKTVWASPMQNNAVCDLCKDAVKVIAGYIGRNQTKQKVERAFLKLCSDVPIKELRVACTKAVTKDFSMLYDEIVVLIENGELICGALGLCSASTRSRYIDMLIKNLPAQIKDEGCGDCQAFLGDVRKVLKSDKSLINEWKELARMECNALGPRVNLVCQDHMEEAIASLVHGVSGNDDMVKMCRRINMCHFKSRKTEKNDMCSDCKNFFEDWKTLIMKNNKIVKEFVKEVSEFYCLQKPQFLRKQCSRYVAMAMKIALNRIMQNTPDEICKAIDFCSAAALLKENQILSLIQQKSMIASGDHCRVCTTLLTDLQGLARYNKSFVELMASYFPIMIARPIDLQDHLADLLEEQCDQLGILSGLCRRQVPVAVTNYLPQFETANVDDICTTLLMCTSPPVKPPVGGDVCQDCIVFTKDWQVTLVHNETFVDNLLDKAALTYCDQLPFFRNKCDEVARQGILNLLDYVKKTEASIICTKVDLCGDVSGRKLLLSDAPQSKPVQVQKQGSVVGFTKESKQESSLACTICLLVADDLDKILEQNATETNIEPRILCVCNRLQSSVLKAEIISALEKVCTLLPTQYKESCDKFISDNYDSFLKSLINLVPPKEVCGLLRLCPKQRVKGIGLCVMCEAIAGELDRKLSDNSTQEEIENALEKVCHLVTGQLRDECDDFIKINSPAILDLLVKDLAPLTICPELHMCPKKKKIVKSTGVPCDVCKVAIEFLDRELEANATREDIERALDRLCARLPSDLTSACDDIVKQFTPEILDLADHIFDPDYVCNHLRFCRENKKPRQIAKSTGTVCDVCKIVIDFLDQELEANATRADIERELDVLCAKLPSELKRACDDIVKQYTPEILDLADHIFDPDYVCNHLRFCRENKKPRQVVKSTGVLCDVCKIAIEVLDQELEANATREDIERALDRLCARLPSDLTSACDDIVKQFTPEILDLADHILDPDYVCSHLDLCGNAKKPGLVGGNPCTYGPSYWCKNEQSAKECHALDHCRLHIWN